MKFKLDENLPVELASDLRSLGYDVDTVHDEGLRGAADPAVVDAALAADRIFFTLDKGIATCGGTRYCKLPCLTSSREYATYGSMLASWSKQTPRVRTHELNG